MIRITLENKTYAIEFRHIRQAGKRPRLGRRAAIRAVTTCAIVACNDDVPAVAFIAIDNAVCDDEDNFSRHQGRDLALRKTLQQGVFREVGQRIMDEYDRLTAKPPSTGSRHEPVQPA